MSRKSVIEVVGGEIAGGKAGMLIEHEALIREAGLEVPQTTVIASEALEPLKRIVNCSDESAEASFLAGFSSRLVRVCRELDYSPILAIRSSGEGDAEGTGVYESLFVSNTPQFAGQGLLRVLQSFHSDRARAFRQRVGLGGEFAVMLQPLVGQYLEVDARRELFGPPLSGLGYSATRTDQYGTINVVAGVGGGVSRSGSEHINYFALSEANELAAIYLTSRPDDSLNFYDYIHVLREAQKGREVEIVNSDFRDQESLAAEQRLEFAHGLALDLAVDEGMHAPSSSLFAIDGGLRSKVLIGHSSCVIDAGNVMLKAMNAFQPKRLLDALQTMETRAGYPLYIEWALQLDGDQVRPYVLQIAPFEQSERGRIEAELPDDPILVGKNIVGHDKHTASKIVYCSNPADIKALNKFNKNPENTGYILVYPAFLTSSLAEFDNLDFADFSNAAVVIEFGSDVHGSSSMDDHFRGMLRKAGVLAAQLDHESTNFVRLLQLLSAGKFVTESSRPPAERLKVLEGQFKVITDAIQDKMFIGQE